MLALTAGLLVPASAGAMTVSYSPSGGLVIEGDAVSETVRVQVQIERFRVIKDNGPTLVAGTGCTTISSGPTPIVQCLVSFQGAISRTVTAKLGDGADDISFLMDSGALGVPASIDGGGGNDTLTAGLRPGFTGDPTEPPVGGPNAAAHVIEGGTGNDVLLGDSGGTDTMRGGPGNDTLRASATLRSADLFDGGAGVDAADYSARADAVSLTTSNLSTPVPNDGAPAEGDDLDGVEALIGGQGADTLQLESADQLVGTPGPPQNPPPAVTPVPQILRGNGGADTLRALGRPLTSMDGGAGRDIVLGAAGSDSIFSRDGERDKIGCGGAADRVSADLKDVPLPADCEDVDASDRREGPNVAVLTRIARVDEAGLLTVRLACPRALRARCSGSLAAGLERRRARFGPKERYSLRPGGSAVVEVALRPGQVTPARRSGARVRVVSIEGGIHGTKTTQRVLEARPA